MSSASFQSGAWKLKSLPASWGCAQRTSPFDGVHSHHRLTSEDHHLLLTVDRDQAGRRLGHEEAAAAPDHLAVRLPERHHRLPRSPHLHDDGVAVGQRTRPVARLDHRPDEQRRRPEVGDEVSRPRADCRSARIEDVQFLVRPDGEQPPVHQQGCRMRSRTLAEVLHVRRIGVLPQRLAGRRIERDDRFLAPPGRLGPLRRRRRGTG